MKELRYVDRFLSLAGEKYRESCFLDDFDLSWSGGDDYNGPAKYRVDVLEIDGRGRLHLWLFDSVRSPNLLSGELIGRLFAWTKVFQLTAPATLAARIEKAAKRRRYDTAVPHFQALVKQRPCLRLDSWNLVACGGRGCELAGREDNLVWQLYAPLGRMVGHVRDVNTWHFYQTATGYDLRSIWDFSVAGGLSLGDRLAIYDGRLDLAPAPEDDFDIGAKRDLHLRRRKGFHQQGHEAYFADHGQILAR